jgi:hypothetical protein
MVQVIASFEYASVFVELPPAIHKLRVALYFIHNADANETTVGNNVLPSPVHLNPLEEYAIV